MSDMRRLLDSFNEISEAGPIKKPGQVMGYEMGGSSGAAVGGGVPNVGAIGAGIAKAKPVSKPPAPVKPTTTSSTTKPQPLPAGVAPSTAGAGRSGQGGPTAAELAAYKAQSAKSKTGTTTTAPVKTANTQPAYNAAKDSQAANTQTPAYNAAKDSQAANAVPSKAPVTQPNPTAQNPVTQWLAGQSNTTAAPSTAGPINTAAQNLQGTLATVKQIPSNLARLAKDPVQYVKDLPAPSPDQLMGALGAGAAGTMARLPSIAKVVKPGTPPAVWRNPRTGQTTTTAPGTTKPQSLPPGVTPSTAGAGRSGQGGPTAAELAAYKAPPTATTTTAPVTQVKPTSPTTTPTATPKPTDTTSATTTTNPVNPSVKPLIQRLPGETPAQAIARVQAATTKPTSPITAPVTRPTATTTTTPVTQVKPTSPTTTTAPVTTAPVTQVKPPPTLTNVVKPTGQTATPGKTPVTRPAEPSKDPNSVGKYRPGGERDTLGRKEPNFGKKEPDPVGNYKPRPDDLGGGLRPPPAKPQNLKKPAIAAAAAAASLYPTELNKDKIPTTTGSAGAAQPPATANGQPQVDGTPSPTKIELPTVGPQGSDSPFYVVPTDTTPKPPAPAPVAPAIKPPTPVAPAPAPIAPSPAPAPVAPAPAPIAPSPAPAIKPPSLFTRPPAATDVKPTPDKDVGAGSGSGTGNAPGTGSDDADDSVEKILRKQGYVKETVIEKLLNDFTKFVESNTKNKSKVK